MNINNILVPRNLEGRKDKLRQHIIKLLSQEVIEGDLIINVLFMDIPIELIKIKEIKGNVDLIKIGYIPSWLKDVKVHGNFNCSFNKLISLEYCPQYVGGYFQCSFNSLTSLEGCPKYVNGNFYCNNNKLNSLESCEKYIGGDLVCWHNKIKLELPKNFIIKGILKNDLLKNKK